MISIEVIIVLVLAALTWFWYDSFKAREAGIDAVRKACEEDGLQLLDETIALGSLKLQRQPSGSMGIARVYNFEFSDTGDNRRRGRVHLLGERVTLLYVGPRLASVNMGAGRLE